MQCDGLLLLYGCYTAFFEPQLPHLMPPDILQFILITLALEITPGPAVLFVLYNSAYGMRYAMSGIAGLLTANIIWITLVASGLGLLLINSPQLYLGMRYVGAVYLVYLGYKIARHGVNPITELASEKKKSRLTSYYQGIMTSLSNPKALLFFLALFPQFARIDHYQSDILFFGALKMTMLFATMTTFGLMGKRIFSSLYGSDYVMWVFRTMGIMIIIAAYGVAFG